MVDSDNVKIRYSLQPKM